MKGILRIRLTFWYGIFLVVFMSLAFLLPKTKFDGAQLTLFSVNSFLYGFYLAPLLSGQKSRIEELTKIIRNESISLFTLRLRARGLTETEQAVFKSLESDYIRALMSTNLQKAEKSYEAMIAFCLDYAGKNKEVVTKLLDKLIDNQQNRTLLAMQLNNSIFSHEWIVLLVLFSITLSFVLFMDTGDGVFTTLLAGLLCAGLTMLLLILAKLSALLHKKAKHIWDPMKELLDSNFRRVY